MLRIAKRLKILMQLGLKEIFLGVSLEIKKIRKTQKMMKINKKRNSKKKKIRSRSRYQIMSL